jgi:hypothetical protein
MRRIDRLLVAISCLSCFFLWGLRPVSAQTAESRVQGAADELQSWLGQDENAPGWRRFLKLEDLTAQVRAGRKASRDSVREILAKFASDTPGLDKSRFVAVREALQAWLDDLAQLRVDELAQAARDAKQHFVPIRVEDVKDARAELVTALERLDGFLAGGCPQNAQNWMQFLHRSELDTQLKAEPGPDWTALLAVAERFYSDESGLEVSYFLAVREALQRYAHALAFHTTPDAPKFVQQHLEELARRLESHQKKANADDAIAIGKEVGWLEQYGQAKDLVGAVRRHLWRPNLFVQLSEDMLKAGIENEVDETLSIHEDILGTIMVGEAHMQGRISLDLVPCDTHAALDILLAGTTDTTNVGYHGQVTVYSDGVTTVDGRKRVLVDAFGVTSRPARAVCQTSSTINNISARSNMVRNIAWKRAMGLKPEAEVIASDRAARKVEAKMDEESADLLDRGHDMFAEKFRNPLVRRGGFPKTLQIRTSETMLHITGLGTLDDQVAAPNDPPALTDNHDIALRVHESLVGNLSQAMFGGVTLTDERLQEMVENLTGDVPEELAVSEDEEPWSITFAKERPIEVRFDAKSFQIWIRGTRFTRGDQEIKRSLVISAKYVMEQGAQGLKMTRQGDVTVDFAKSSGTQSVQQVTMRTFMKKKFEKLFKAESASDGFALPGPWQTAGKFRLQQLHCDAGWLVLGWQQPSPTERTATRKSPIVID